MRGLAKGIEVKPLIRSVTISEGFTQSELSTYGACPQKWFWRYNLLLEKSGSFSFALMVGSAFHAAMEEFYATKGKRCTVATLQFEEDAIASADDLLKLEYWNQILPMMVKAYCIYYKDDAEKWDIESIEEKVDIGFEGWRLRGMIDLRFAVLKTGRWILDHKTSARLSLDTVAGWDFRFQFMFYLWLKVKMGDTDLKGYYVNAIKKPELRQKKTETIEQFAQRVFEDMVAEPDKYMYREKYPVTTEMLEHFEKAVVVPRLKLLATAADPLTPRDLAEALVFNKNTDECQRYTGAPCPYIDLCRHGYQKMGFLYRQREQKHQELDVE